MLQTFIDRVYSCLKISNNVLSSRHFTFVYLTLDPQNDLLYRRKYFKSRLSSYFSLFGLFHGFSGLYATFHLLVFFILDVHHWGQRAGLFYPGLSSGVLP